jgi:hypothetical protein
MRRVLGFRSMLYHSGSASRLSTQTIVPCVNWVTTADEVLGPSRTIAAGTITRKSVQDGGGVAVGNRVVTSVARCVTCAAVAVRTSCARSVASTTPMPPVRRKVCTPCQT